MDVGLLRISTGSVLYCRSNNDSLTGDSHTFKLNVRDSQGVRDCVYAIVYVYIFRYINNHIAVVRVNVEQTSRTIITYLD